MRLLSFEIKRNLQKAPRVHVKSLTKKIPYGSFPANNPSEFSGWNEMSDAEVVELKHFMNNLNAVSSHLGEAALNELADYRLRLPINLAQAIDEIGSICHQSSIELDIFEPIVSSIVQELKIAVAKLKGEHKTKALSALDQLGLAKYKKLDYSQKIKAIFSEVLSVHNKSEKLHQKAKLLFNKDKSYSPKSIESMAFGELVPSKWLVTCAISLLLDERPTVLKNVITTDDLFMLFAKQLLDNNKKSVLLKQLKKHQLDFLKARIDAYKIKDS